MNEQNLKPFNTWSADDHRAASSKGGIASGLVRRRNAAIHELLEITMYNMRLDEHIENIRRKEKRRKQRELRNKRTKYTPEPMTDTASDDDPGT